jgi:hypothetical protein
LNKQKLKIFCISGLSNETGQCSAGYYCSGGSPTATPVGQAYGILFIIVYRHIILR